MLKGLEAPYSGSTLIWNHQQCASHETLKSQTCGLLVIGLNDLPFGHERHLDRICRRSSFTHEIRVTGFVEAIFGDLSQLRTMVWLAERIQWSRCRLSIRDFTTDLRSGSGDQYNANVIQTGMGRTRWKHNVNEFNFSGGNDEIAIKYSQWHMRLSNQLSDSTINKRSHWWSVAKIDGSAEAVADIPGDQNLSKFICNVLSSLRLRSLYFGRVPQVFSPS
ncbi:hypothetical protein CSKR_103055 [Clonorchis sinensis]|uniref:Uncharacterized protein n=1 Tax=Clonorchis sinensis TaxID=79923 RepID=A0A3R7DJM0_CLOSI|nr:hypothetical protein CSKR_103055 [Clonorchis sinensis]